MAAAPAFEEWLLMLRERALHRVLRILGRLADAHRQRGEYDRAYEVAARQVALDPCREEAHNLSPEVVPDVVRICQLVQGAPLVLAIAAGWVRLLDCASIAAEIGRSLEFLTTPLRDVPARHRSVEVVFLHS